MGGLPDVNPRDIYDYAKKLEARIANLERRSPYTGTGMHPNGANGVEVDGDLIIDGNLDLNGAGTVDGSLTIGGSVSVDGAGKVGGTWMSDAFNGNLGTGAPGTTGWAFNNNRAILPELILRPGSVSNDALTDPVVPGVVNLTTNNFSVGVPWIDAVSTSLTVPAGCTRLLLTASVWLQLFNTKTSGGADGAGSDYIYTRIRLGATTGQHTSTGVSGNSGTATATSGMSALLSGLTPGSTVSLAGQASTDYVIATSTFNKVVATATLFWLK